MKFIFYLIWLLAPAAEPDLFREVDSITAGLCRITGWTVQRRVPADLLSKAKFRHFLEQRVEKAAKPDEVRGEELVLKMLGLVPPDFDLKQSTVDLVSEQAAAYYDYDRKRLFILESTPAGMERRMALVHELAHALADQRHSLGRFIRRGAKTDEGVTARQAVMEGQAAWLTAAFLASEAGMKAEAPKALLETEELGGAQYPVYSNAPLYLRESLVFPYRDGIRFQDQVYRRLGRPAFDEVFRRAPCTTRQILHPDAYFAGSCPPRIELPHFRERGYRDLIEGAVGELEHQILLRQYVGDREARAQCLDWRAAAVRIWEHKKDRHAVMGYVSEWASEDAARRFLALYRRVMTGKWKKMEVRKEGPDELAGIGDSGEFRIRREGSRVSALEGLR